MPVEEKRICSTCKMVSKKHLWIEISISTSAEFTVLEQHKYDVESQVPFAYKANLIACPHCKTVILAD